MIKRDIRAQIVIVENGKYILLKHHHKQEKRYFWGEPGGGKEDYETIEEAAIREAKEETELDIKLLPFKNEVSFGNADGLYKRKITFIGYPIKGEAKTGYDPEEDLRLLFELVDIKWHPISDTVNVDEVTRGDILPN